MEKANAKAKAGVSGWMRVLVNNTRLEELLRSVGQKEINTNVPFIFDKNHPIP